MASGLAQRDIEAVAMVDRAVREEEKARRAASWGETNTAATDWMRRDARELTWQDRTRREWAVDDRERLDQLLVKSGTVGDGGDECAPPLPALRVRAHAWTDC